MRLIALIMSLALSLLLAPGASADDCCVGADELSVDRSTASVIPHQLSSGLGDLAHTSHSESASVPPCCTDPALQSLCFCSKVPVHGAVVSPTRPPLPERYDVCTASHVRMRSYPVIAGREVDYQQGALSRGRDRLARLQL